MGIPHVTDVAGFMEMSHTHAVCRKLTDAGYDILRIGLPALFTVAKDINMPRLPSIAGVKASYGKSLRELGVNDMPLDPKRIGLIGSPTQVVRTFIPKRRGSIERIGGEKDEQARAILRIIGEVM